MECQGQNEILRTTYLADTPHPHDAQRQLRRIRRRASDKISPPPLSRRPLRNARILQYRQYQKHAHIRRGLRHRIARVAEPDVISGQPVYIDPVVACGRGGDYLEAWE